MHETKPIMGKISLTFSMHLDLALGLEELGFVSYLKENITYID
jgi:hypothetical protein